MRQEKENCFTQINAFLESQENQPTFMWNSSGATNATCCDAEEAFLPHAQINVVGLIVFSFLLFGLCFVIAVFASLRDKRASHQAQVEADVASHERKEERKRIRKEFILNGLIVSEWVSDDALVESTTGGQDTPPSGEEAADAPQPPAPPTNSTSASCVMGSDDCESLAEEDEMAGCAICLSHFRPQQLVCKSNNSSCQHVFHKDCMVDWLMKRHESCPMCREVYLLKTV
jgi:hypothetical protein